MTLARDVLFIIGAPFEDVQYPGKTWFCRDCATMEGALAGNPGWTQQIEVRRLPYPRPRQSVIELLGEENQSLPVLVLADASEPPENARWAVLGTVERAFLTEPKAILRYLGDRYGGVGQHP